VRRIRQCSKGQAKRGFSKYREFVSGESSTPSGRNVKPFLAQTVDKAVIGQKCFL